MVTIVCPTNVYYWVACHIPQRHSTSYARWRGFFQSFSVLLMMHQTKKPRPVRPTKTALIRCIMKEDQCSREVAAESSQRETQTLPAGEESPAKAISIPNDMYGHDIERPRKRRKIRDDVPSPDTNRYFEY